jgi:glutamate decarboxylase
MGEENVLNIPADKDHKMDIEKLSRRLKTLNRKKERTRIVAIVGIAGTTETGNVDNLQALAEASRDADTHFHVDACWGGSALLVDAYRCMFKGIEEADSVSIDAHKLLYCPMTMGLVLFHNERDLNYLKHTSNYVIRRNSVDTGRFTIEGSRPFACLKPWASMKIIGRQGYELLFKSARENTDALKEILDNCGNFETLNDPELFIIIYRFIPEIVRKQLAEWEALKHTREERDSKEMEKKIGRVNRVINALNIKLHKALRMDDTSFVSRTTLESTIYRPQNIVVLRAVLSNPLTDKDVLKEVVDTQNRIGMGLWSEFEAAYRKIAG